MGTRTITSRKQSPDKITHPIPSDAGHGTFVYVIDDGIKLNHPEFHGRKIQHLRAYPNKKLQAEHGTAVARLICGHTLGIARGTTLIDVGISTEAGPGSFSVHDIKKAIDLVIKDVAKKKRQGIAIVNMS